MTRILAPENQGNPIDAMDAQIAARLIGSFEEVNRKFDGHLREIVNGMQGSFRKVA